MEVAVVVDDAFAQVDVASLTIAVLVHEGGAEDRDVAVSLKCEMDVLRGIGEALAVPDEVAYCRSVWVVLYLNANITVVVADVLVEVDISVVPLAIGPLETGSQYVAVLDADLLSCVVEGHVGWCLRSLWYEG